MRDTEKTKEQLIAELAASRKRISELELMGKAPAASPDRRMDPNAYFAKDSGVLFRNLVEAIPDLVWLKNLDGVYLGSNPTFERFFGATAADIIGKTDYDFVDKDLADFFRAHDRKAMEKDGPSINEEWLTFASGGYHGLFETIKTPLRDTNGEVIGVLGISRDITERKRAEEELRQTSQFLTSLITHANAPIIVWDPEFRITQFNQAFERLTGLEDVGVIGRPLTILFPPDRVASTMEYIRQSSYAGAQWETVEIPIQHVDGSVKTVLWNSAGIQDQDGNKIIATIAQGQDITERKRAEEALFSSNRTLKAIKESGRTLVRAQDERSYINSVCKILVDMCGYAMAWVGIPYQDENKSVKPIGSWGAGEGYLESILITWDDSETSNGPTGNAIKTRQLQISRDIATDPAMTPWRTEAMGRNFGSSIAFPLCNDDVCLGALSIYARKADAFDAAEIDLLAELANDLAFGITSLRRKEEHRKAEAELRANEELLRNILIGIKAGIIIIDPSTFTIVEANTIAGEILGTPVEDIVGKPCSGIKWHRGKDGLRVEECPLLRGNIINEEFRIERPDGSIVPVVKTVISVRRSGTLLFYEIIFDMTARKDLERQLMLAQRLESIGGLAAGIAHEINTPIQFVGDNLSFLEGAFADLITIVKEYGGHSKPAKARQNLEFILEEVPKALTQSREGVTRIAGIVSSMKRFSHVGGDEKSLLDIPNAIQNTLTISRNEWKYRAEIQLDLDSSARFLSCIPGEFNQVLLNLLVNASHAVSEKYKGLDGEKGTITIKTRRDGDWFELSVTDTGCGIQEQNLHRIFDPFFTTKEVGKGTGQGLAFCHDIVVKKHSGTITATSKPGEGATFTLRFPLLGEEKEQG
jgi:PAS domain S-box-containing protein